MSSVPERNDVVAQQDQEEEAAAAAAAAAVVNAAVDAVIAEHEQAAAFAVANNDFVAAAAFAAAVAANDMRRAAANRKEPDTISLSSSIGLLSDGDDGEDEDGEEAQSKAEIVEGSLNSFASLEAALPFKRGLSGFYDGKSRSFMNLGDVKSMEEVEKEESPLNKRRRLTVSQSSFYKWSTGSSSSSMPHLPHTGGENAHTATSTSTTVGVDQQVDDQFKSGSTSSFSSANSTNKPSSSSIN